MTTPSSTNKPKLRDETEYLQSLPKKRMGAGALFFQREKILIVKPSYRDYWLIPGGVVEQGESPRVSCEREVFEEIGLKVSLRDLLVVDYRDEPGARGDSLQFIFDGGELSDARTREIRLADSELTEFRLLPPDEAIPLLEINLGQRVRHCVLAREKRLGLYLENARIPE